MWRLCNSNSPSSTSFYKKPINLSIHHVQNNTSFSFGAWIPMSSKVLAWCKLTSTLAHLPCSPVNTNSIFNWRLIYKRTLFLFFYSCQKKFFTQIFINQIFYVLINPVSKLVFNVFQILFFFSFEKHFLNLYSTLSICNP